MLSQLEEGTGKLALALANEASLLTVSLKCDGDGNKYKSSRTFLAGVDAFT